MTLLKKSSRASGWAPPGHMEIGCEGLSQNLSTLIFLLPQMLQIQKLQMLPVSGSLSICKTDGLAAWTSQMEM